MKSIRMLKNKETLESLEQFYNEYDNKLRKQRLKIGLCLAIVFSVLFGGLDFVYYPQYAEKLIAVRLLAEVFLIGFFVFAYFNKIKNIKVASIVWALFLFIFIDILIFLTEGASSPYYAGLSLIIVGLLLVMPWSFLETLFICLCLLFFYAVTTLLHHKYTGIEYDVRTFVNNMFFMIGTSVICVTASYFNSKQRLKEFYLNYEVEQNNKRLVALDEMKSCFFSNMSHEFRTPLSLITGPINDVLKDYKNQTLEKIEPNLQLIQQNSSRLMRLINNLLDVMKLDEKKYKINPQAIEMNGFVEGLVDEISYSAKSKNITLTKIVPESASYIHADFDAMEKVILNLLTNAIKFTEDNGKIHVEVNNSGDEIIIAVQDNGIGISQEHLSYIFDRFQQVDDSHTRKHQGSGLGLALVKNLVMLQKGKIEVESKSQKGSRFTLRFPKVSTDIAADHQSKRKQISAIENQSIICDHDEKCVMQKDQHTILIVDDEPDMLFYIKNIFLHKTYNIISAKDGKEALHMIDKYHPDLVILDVMMPEIDGLSVCKKLKEDDKNQLIKVLMLTAKSDEESKILALKYGCDDFITKPFCSDEIVTRVDNLLHSSTLHKDLFQELEHVMKTLHVAQDTLLKSHKLSAALDIPTSTLQEIKHPLGYCVAALYTLKMDPAVMKDDNLHEAIIEIEESINAMNKIISDIRSFTVPKDCDIEKFDIKELIDESLAFISQTQLENITVDVDSVEETKVIASRSHIGLVIVDLVRSAVRNINKSNRDGNIKIIVKSEQPGQALISIMDNGLEISTEDLDMIFKPFFDFNSLSKGVEMGLNTSYLIVKAHNSELKVRSEKDRGNEFSFVLPVW